MATRETSGRGLADSGFVGRPVALLSPLFRISMQKAHSLPQLGLATSDTSALFESQAWFHGIFMESCFTFWIFLSFQQMR